MTRPSSPPPSARQQRTSSRVRAASVAASIVLIKGTGMGVFAALIPFGLASPPPAPDGRHLASPAAARAEAEGGSLLRKLFFGVGGEGAVVRLREIAGSKVLRWNWWPPPSRRRIAVAPPSPFPHHVVVVVVVVVIVVVVFLCGRTPRW